MLVCICVCIYACALVSVMRQIKGAKMYAKAMYILYIINALEHCEETIVRRQRKAATSMCAKATYILYIINAPEHCEETHCEEINEIMCGGSYVCTLHHKFSRSYVCMHVRQFKLRMSRYWVSHVRA